MGRRSVHLVLGAFALAVGVAAAGCHPSGAHFTVTSTSDAADSSVGDGTCRSTASGGPCTLRAAIQEANARAGHDVIGFSITGDGPHRIAPGTRLPSLTDTAGVTIDGYTEPGSAPNTSSTASNAVIKIEVRGRGPTGIDGFLVSSPDNVIRGLAIWDFRIQVLIGGAGAVRNQVVGTFLGTNAAGTAAATAFATSHGAVVDRGASDNQIGAPGNANRNVISGNWQNGVSLYDVGTRRNRIQNNLVGLRPDGSTALPNTNHGVDVNEGATDTLVGGTGTGERNVVSGNGLTGVEISHDASTLRNDVIGNLIGVAANGVTARGNAQYGVYLEGHGGCTTTCSPDAGESTVSGNVIVNNNGGVAIQKGRHDDVVRGNHIGVLPNGTAAPNRAFGVRIEMGSHRTTVGPLNVIAGNGGGGVQIQATGTNPASTAEFPTFSNRITRNSMYGNAGLGIDLAPLSAVTTSPPENVNGGVKVPSLAMGGSEVRATTCAGCTVELFRADVTSTTQYGEGRDFLASASADSAGVARFDASALRGQVVTATTTDSNANTSEFSRNLLIP